MFQSIFLGPGLVWMRYISKNSLLVAIAMVEFLVVGVLDISWTIRLEIVLKVNAIKDGVVVHL